MTSEDSQRNSAPRAQVHAPVARTEATAHTESENNKPGWRAALVGADERGKTANASWGSIFVGVAVTLATMLVLSFLGTALGLGIFDLESGKPFQGVGVGLGIWLVLTIVISFGLGGYVAGTLAVRAGLLHGLATFATAVLVLFAAIALGLSSLFGALGNIVGGTASTLGSGASSLASAVGDGIGSVVDTVSERVDVDGNQVQQQTEDILRGTGVEELQPEYLQNQVSEASDEVTNAAKELVVHPENYEQILNDLGDSLGARAEKIGDSIDRDAIARSVEQNTDLTGPEAQQATDNAYEAVEKGTQAVKDGLESAQEAIPQAVEDAKQMVDEAKATINDATSAIAGASVWIFVALVLAAVLTAFAGAAGSRTVAARNVEGELETSPRRRAI